MKRIACASLLLFAATLLAQQQGVPPYNSPPAATPPTFPQDPRPGQPIPPDTRAPEPRDRSDEPIPPDTQVPTAIQPSNLEVQEQVQHKLATEPLLKDVQINAFVNDGAIVLSGMAENEQQRKLALRVAESYAGERQVVDRIRVPD